MSVPCADARVVLFRVNGQTSVYSKLLRLYIVVF